MTDRGRGCVVYIRTERERERPPIEHRARETDRQIAGHWEGLIRGISPVY